MCPGGLPLTLLTFVAVVVRLKHHRGFARWFDRSAGVAFLGEGELCSSADIYEPCDPPVGVLKLFCRMPPSGWLAHLPARSSIGGSSR